MKSKNDFDVVNYLALELLEFLGNKNPSEAQIQLIEELIGTNCIKKRLTMSEKLSPREQSCLLLAAYGKSTHEISDLLKIKPNTVVSYRKEIIRKLGCKNIAQAVFTAIQYNFLHYYAWRMSDK